MTHPVRKSLANEFGYKIARVMMKLKSSHCYFILQQAYKGEYLSWEEAEEIMKAVIKEQLPPKNKRRK